MKTLIATLIASLFAVSAIAAEPVKADAKAANTAKPAALAEPAKKDVAKEAPKAVEPAKKDVAAPVKKDAVAPAEPAKK